MNNKICNPKTEVPQTKEMNDCNYLTDMLETEKNMSVNLCIALNEASNEDLFEELKDLFEDVKECQRDLYELSFKKGWYSLEAAEQNKIEQTYNELLNKYTEIKQD